MNYGEIVKQFGTPTYVFNAVELRKRIKYIRSYLNDYRIIYAVKSNTFIINELDSLVDGYEICSFGEYNICKNLNISKDKCLISGVYKDYNSIDTMFNDGIEKYTIESLNQYQLLCELTKKYNKEINVLIRLTSGNQFGVTKEEFKQILNNKNDLINIKGIEYFSGTQKHLLKKIDKEVDYLIEFIEEIESEYSINIEEVEYGPGAPVFYFQGEEFNEDEYFEYLANALKRINKKVSLEIGRSIAASCGNYLTSVVDIKNNNGIILDGGINHLVYYGQTMAMRLPYFEVYPKRNSEQEIYNLYGSLCTINDIIVKNVSTNKLELNDTFIFKNVGAYSVTEGISLFLSRDLPKVVIYDGVYHLVRDIVSTSDINYPIYKRSIENERINRNTRRLKTRC